MRRQQDVGVRPRPHRRLARLLSSGVHDLAHPGRHGNLADHQYRRHVYRRLLLQREVRHVRRYHTTCFDDDDDDDDDKEEMFLMLDAQLIRFL